MSSLRRLIRNVAASCHWFYFSKRSRFEPVVALRRFDPFAVALCTTFESIEGLRFIQIGANDGISNDPIYDFATQYHWTGSLYEPMAGPFQTLQENYRRFPSCQPVNKAVSTSAGMLQFWYVQNDGSLPEWTSQITSTDREHVVQHRAACPEIINHIQCTEVETIDIRTIVNSVSAVDLLCIDAEGLDHELLMAVDSEQLPDFICFEQSHLDHTQREQLESKLRDSGHEIWQMGLDSFAFRRK